MIVRVIERRVTRRDLNILHPHRAGFVHHDVAWLLGHVNDRIALLNEEGA
jgi:hypothetical protein